MNLDFCKGVVVIIDDKALPKKDEGNDLIIKIIEKISANGLPTCVFTKLSEAQKAIINFWCVSFLILDWDLQGDLDIEGVEDIIKPTQKGRVVKFINDFKKICFCPIFIFSNTDIMDIRYTLEQNNIYFEDKNNFIHIQAKKDLVRGEKLFKVIDNWINQNPTIYTMKNWENSFFKAKNDIFWELFSKSPSWPKVMWESFTEDAVDPHSNLNDVIYSLIKSRTSLTKLDPKKINKRRHPINHEEIKDVIQGMMFLEKKNIPENEIKPGDIFTRGNSKYYLNIRPECDTIYERIDKVGKKLYDGKVYLIKGEKILPRELKNYCDPKVGLKMRHDQVLLYGIDGKDFVKFNFKEIEILNYDDIKDKMCCRLITPYINSVQQQFSSYIGRFGLPRIPNRILKATFRINKPKEE